MPSQSERQIPHGTHNGYVNHRCRCTACKRAAQDYRRRYASGEPTKEVERGRPRDVLRYIDYCLEPKRPFIFNLNGGTGEMYRALREAQAGLRAAEERARFTKALVDAQAAVIKALEDLAAVRD